MVNRSQIVQKTKLQWSLLLAVLFGVCSFSAPHLLGHAHAHHSGSGRISRVPGSSHRSRSGSNNADGEHDSDVVATLKAHDPHAPDHASNGIAVVPAVAFVPVQWAVFDVFVPQDKPLASLLTASSHRGRAPPVA